MSDMVLVAMARAEAESLLGEPRSKGLLDPSWDTPAEAKVRAALGRDPAVLEEQIARAICGVTFKPGTVDRFFSDPTMSVVKDQALAQARAVLASIGEGQRENG